MSRSKQLRKWLSVFMFERVLETILATGATCCRANSPALALRSPLEFLAVFSALALSAIAGIQDSSGGYELLKRL